MSYASGDISKKEILEAATRIFIEKGYNGARMQEIADAAMVNKGMIFYYFENKDKLYNEVFTIVFKETIPDLYQSLNGDLSIREKLFNFIENLIDSAVKNPEKVTFIVNEVNFYPNRDVHLDLLINYIDYNALQQQCDEEAKKGTIKKVDFREIILIITSITSFPVIGREMYSKLYGYKNSIEFLEYHKNRKNTIKSFINNILSP